MSTTDHGTQQIHYQYYEEITGAFRGQRLLGILPVGMYLGGYLTRVSDTEVTLSTLVAEIRNGTNQISVRTTVAATLNSVTLDSGAISSGTPYLVLRWAYAETIANYVEIHALATLTVREEHDVVLGKCVFDGSTLSSFDYSDRTVAQIESQNLLVEATPDTEMYVRLHGGVVNTGSAKVVIGDQKVGLFVAPTGANSRIDLVYIDSTGAPQILQGTAAITPSAPAYGSRLVLAEVKVVNGDTTLTWDRITDVRAFLAFPQTSTTQMIESSGTDDITYSVAAWATIPDMTVNITTVGGKVHISGCVPMAFASDEYYNAFRLRIDGVVQFQRRLELGYHQTYVAWDISFYADLAAGAHTIDLQWYREQANILQAGSSFKRYLQVVELS